MSITDLIVVHTWWENGIWVVIPFVTRQRTEVLIHSTVNVLKLQIENKGRDFFGPLPET